MKSANDRLIEELQRVSHPGGDYEIMVAGPMERGRIIIRNGRIKFSRCGKLEAQDALEKLILVSDASISTRDLSDDSTHYVDEMDLAVDEVIIPLLLRIVTEPSEECDISQADTVRLPEASADLHHYDIMLEFESEEWGRHKFYLHQGRNLVGRSEHCHIQIENDSVSRVHAAITVTSHAIEMEDLQTTNGTRINGVKVIKAKLHNGDELLVGDVRFRLRLVLKCRGHRNRQDSTWTQRLPEHDATGSDVIHFSNYENISKRTIGISHVLRQVLHVNN